jgi:DNA polymerase-3 subunit delta
MVALKPRDVETFVARPSPAQPIVLVYGPDAGLVRERASALMHATVDDPDDPFSVVRLDGEAVASEPLRLVEEANTIPLFGGKRIIWLRAGSKNNIVPAIEALLSAPSPECRVIIEAGDLRKTSPLRSLCERAKNSVALPCYGDDESRLARLIDEELRTAGLTIAPDARVALIPFLGGDREASRNELRKLTTYAQGRGRITVEDVFAIVADASALALDEIADAVFTGRLAELEVSFRKARNAGTAPGAIIGAVLRHAMVLHRMALAAAAGGSAEEAMRAARPPVHFSRQDAIEGALQRWSAERLMSAIAQLDDALLQARKFNVLDETLAHRALTSLAAGARRR